MAKTYFGKRVNKLSIHTRELTSSIHTGSCSGSMVSTWMSSLNCTVFFSVFTVDFQVTADAAAISYIYIRDQGAQTWNSGMSQRQLKRLVQILRYNLIQAIDKTLGNVVFIFVELLFAQPAVTIHKMSSYLLSKGVKQNAHVQNECFYGWYICRTSIWLWLRSMTNSH